LEEGQRESLRRESGRAKEGLEVGGSKLKEAAA
jgi:hypothetical protein